MNEDFVTYELAVKLKEKGFDEPCYGYYHCNGGNDSFEFHYLPSNTNYNKYHKATAKEIIEHFTMEGGAE